MKQIDKPSIVALNQTITWAREFKNRKTFKKEQIIELIRQLQGDQRDADAEYYEDKLEHLTQQLKLADKNCLELINEFDNRAEQVRAEVLKEAGKKLWDMGERLKYKTWQALDAGTMPEKEKDV